ncbi:hypothetical protein LRAMOSA04818 [Lichtheimia ramosa]|uniref:Uncharacterized protein n=1 Tax=Lichtheimia ramosa TaxID=688394 RepID=A0A077X0R7_9FUNG|nr:hypothetical protein LRAMOSA04818 [Lichtheimia ramosa]
MVLEYHRQRFTTYKNHVRRHWPGVDPYPITADKLLRLINDKKDTMGLIALRNLIYSQKKHPSHGPEWKREVLKHPQVAALLKEVTAASKNQQQQTPKSSMNIDHPLEQVTFASNDMSSQPKRRPGRPAGCMNMSKMTMLSQLGTTMQSPTRKRGGPLGVKDKKRRYPYGSTKTMTKTDTTQTKRAYMGSKAKLSSSKRVRFAIERPDGDNGT